MAKMVVIPEVDMVRFPERALEGVAKEIAAIEQTKHQISVRLQELQDGVVVKGGKRIPVDEKRTRQDIMNRVASLRQAGEIEKVYTVEEAAALFKTKRIIPLNGPWGGTEEQE